MKNILKALLKKNQLSNDPTAFNAQVVLKGNMGISNIVDELIKDGIKMDKETMMNIITSFNRKSADLVLSGYNVNNGLVNMRSSVKGPLNEGKWDPNYNWVDVTISHGVVLYEAVAQTTVEIIDEKDESLQKYNLSEQTNQFTGNSQNKIQYVETLGSRLKITGEPACGIAFRNWLCKA